MNIKEIYGLAEKTNTNVYIINAKHEVEILVNEHMAADYPGNETVIGLGTNADGIRAFVDLPKKTLEHWRIKFGTTRNLEN